MILFKKADELSKYLRTIPQTGEAIGFVPTMGALHEGHISLINTCKAISGITVASIFVNPTQFNDPADFAKYPSTIEQDILALERANCDILFYPDVSEIYPAGTGNAEKYDLGYLETLWEGHFRPGHFQGVCQVMDRLLSIVMPDQLFMGRKDYQQCMVINRLIKLKNWPIQLRISPTVREISGLALSSRNRRLNADQQGNATAIFRSMQYLRDHLQPGSLVELMEGGKRIIMDAGFEKIDYLAFANADTLGPETKWDGQQQLVILAAAFIGGVRLIDNLAAR